VQPEINHGKFAIKRIAGESIKVTADIYADGHDQILANLLFRKQGEQNWEKSNGRPPIKLVERYSKKSRER